jgi:hypothetical protein
VRRQRGRAERRARWTKWEIEWNRLLAENRDLYNAVVKYAEIDNEYAVTANTTESCIEVGGARQCDRAIQTNNVNIDDRGYIYALNTTAITRPAADTEGGRCARDRGLVMRDAGAPAAI